MDIANLVPEIAKWLGLAPSTLLLIIMVISTIANVLARRIPDTATGWLGAVRTVCKVIGAHVNSRIAPGVTLSDVAKASMAVPRIAENVKISPSSITGEAEVGPWSNPNAVPLGGEKYEEHPVARRSE